MDNYPYQSPYTYCGWNPIRIIDPDGMSEGNPDWYEPAEGDNTAKIWVPGNAPTTTVQGEKYNNIGSTYSIQLSDGTYENYYQNYTISHGAKADALNTILSSEVAMQRFMSSKSVLTSDKVEVMKASIYYAQNAFINDPRTQVATQVALFVATGGIEGLIELYGAGASYVAKRLAAKGVTKELSVAEQAANLSKRINKNSFIVGDLGDGMKMQYDFLGATHKGVPTPHVQLWKLNVNPVTGVGNYNKVSKFVIPMTQKHINYLENYFNLMGY